MAANLRGEKICFWVIRGGSLVTRSRSWGSRGGFLHLSWNG